MEWFFEAAIIISMFVLRLGVPIVLMFLISCALRRLDARWQAEALARHHQLALSNPDAVPVAAALPAAAGGGRLIQEPCWEYKACPESVRAKCPAYLDGQVPCWFAQRAATGQLPVACCTCSIFTTAPRMGVNSAA